MEKNIAIVTVRQGRAILATKKVTETMFRKTLRIMGTVEINKAFTELMKGITFHGTTMNHSYTFNPLFQED